jgi:hypothetical protein
MTKDKAKRTGTRTSPGSGNISAAMASNRLGRLDAASQRRSAMETENFFADRRKRADDAAFLRILNREGGEPPRPEDTLD